MDCFACFFNTKQRPSPAVDQQHEAPPVIPAAPQIEKASKTSSSTRTTFVQPNTIVIAPYAKPNYFSTIPIHSFLWHDTIRIIFCYLPSAWRISSERVCKAWQFVLVNMPNNVKYSDPIQNLQMVPRLLPNSATPQRQVPECIVETWYKRVPQHVQIMSACWLEHVHVQVGVTKNSTMQGQMVIDLQPRTTFEVSNVNYSSSDGMYHFEDRRVFSLRMPNAEERMAVVWCECDAYGSSDGCDIHNDLHALCNQWKIDVFAFLVLVERIWISFDETISYGIVTSNAKMPEYYN